MTPGAPAEAKSRAVVERTVEPEAVRTQLDKILASEEFSDSERMCRFLRFVVEEKLNGGPGRLKEIVIGLEVFDKKPPYDPRIDPIVRVEARRLRSKLHKYYEHGGREDHIVIELPKGRYSPVFQEKALALQSTKQCNRIVAVLPFANLSPEPDGDYFADGLTEELIHALTKVEGLTVVAWNTASQLKGREADIDRIREELRVTHVLRGSVRRTGERLRIAAQLIKTEDGAYRWSETYDRLARDVFAIQEEIAAAIVHALKLNLSGARLISGRTPSVEYYNIYLKGRYHWNQRTSDGLKRCIAHFEQAIKLDDQCALAYTGLADAYTLLADYGLQTSFEVMPKAIAAGERALQLDPESAEAFTSLALVRSLYEWRWKDAGELYRRAIQLNPGYATAHLWYGIDYLALLGNFAEAEKEIDTALELDPLSLAALEGRGYVCALSRRYDKAVDAYKRALQVDPSFYKGYTSMGRAHTLAGNYEAGIEMLEKGRALAGDVPSIVAALTQTYALAGKTTEATRLLTELHSLSERRYVPATCFAVAYLGFGDKETALIWLERGADRRELPLSAVYVHPVYDPLSADPRFQTLIRRMGFDQASIKRAGSLP